MNKTELSETMIMLESQYLIVSCLADSEKKYKYMQKLEQWMSLVNQQMEKAA